MLSLVAVEKADVIEIMIISTLGGGAGDICCVERCI